MNMCRFIIFLKILFPTFLKLTNYIEKYAKVWILNRKVAIQYRLENMKLGQCSFKWEYKYIFSALTWNQFHR